MIVTFKEDKEEEDDDRNIHRRETSVTLFSQNKTLLTDTGDVCHQKVASLWHNGLKPCSPQT